MTRAGFMGTIQKRSVSYEVSIFLDEEPPVKMKRPQHVPLEDCPPEVSTKIRSDHRGGFPPSQRRRTCYDANSEFSGGAKCTTDHSLYLVQYVKVDV